MGDKERIEVVLSLRGGISRLVKILDRDGEIDFIEKEREMLGSGTKEIYMDDVIYRMIGDFAQTGTYRGCEGPLRIITYKKESS